MTEFIDAYRVDCDGIYKGCIQVQLCPVTRKDYLLPADAVLDAPPEHDEIKQYALRDGEKWVIRPLMSLSEYRNSLINLSNSQCQAAIVDKYPMHKQFNTINEAIVSGDTAKAQAMYSFIDEQRATCKALKTQIVQATTQSELEKIENTFTKAVEAG